VTKSSETNQVVPRRNPKVPNSIALLFASQEEDGESRRQIANMWGVAPSTVKAAIDRVPADQLRAIRQIHALQELKRNQEILDKIHDALMQRDLAEKRKDGSYMITAASLVTMKAILVDKTDVLNPLAGTADPTDSSSAMNPLAALLHNDREISDALKSLPQGTKAKVEMSMELSKDQDDSDSSSDSAVDADFEVFGD
jgi:hypothetical protein